jgi:DNA-directed RNA polymerase specialized sigma24 family protein
MKGKRARFGTLVVRYYSTVYSFASRLTDDPREAVLLTHEAFTTTRKKLRNHRSEVEFVTTLLDAITERGFLGARIEPRVTAV